MGLKPCPFCGKEARISTKLDGSWGRVWYVRCSKCNARAEGYYEPDSLEEYVNPHEKVAQTIDLAVESWNRRANDD